MMLEEIISIIRCPRCRNPLIADENDSPKSIRSLHCSDPACSYAKRGFPIVNGQPVLIDFDASIFDESRFLASQGEPVIARDDARVRLTTKIRRLGAGHNRAAKEHCRQFISTMKLRCERPRALVIGGGEIGSGAECLYSDPDIILVGTDVYVSANTLLVIDAHQLPFSDLSFDGVWIQAVLEHVLDPAAVVTEIHRVLKIGGVVYADTPFMQQVHEGAYDFTRFTLSGHRWLFRKFHHDSSGAVSGAGTA